MTVSNLTISYFCLLPNFLTQKKTSTNYKLPCDLFFCVLILFLETVVFYICYKLYFHNNLLMEEALQHCIFFHVLARMVVKDIDFIDL